MSVCIRVVGHRAETIPIFPEPVLEPEPQSCSAKRTCTGADSTVESVPECETQFLDRHNHPIVRKQTENRQKSVTRVMVYKGHHREMSILVAPNFPLKNPYWWLLF